MYSKMYFPREADHVSLFHGRYTVAVLVLLCVALLSYASLGVLKDVWLVNEAFPSLPSYFATDMETAILFSPVMLCAKEAGDSFLRFIKYPPLTLPNAPLPTGNPVGDQIVKAQREQGLLRPGGAVPLSQIMELNQSSLETLGRAIYLSQESSDAALAFEQGRGGSIAHPAFEHEPARRQVQQLFEAAYGLAALQAATAH